MAQLTSLPHPSPIQGVFYPNMVMVKTLFPIRPTDTKCILGNKSKNILNGENFCEYYQPEFEPGLRIRISISKKVAPVVLKKGRIWDFQTFEL